MDNLWQEFALKWLESGPDRVSDGNQAAVLNEAVIVMASPAAGTPAGGADGRVELRLLPAVAGSPQPPVQAVRSSVPAAWNRPMRFRNSRCIGEGKARVSSAWKVVAM